MCNDSGELFNFYICGFVYMVSVVNKFVILIKLEDVVFNIGGIVVLFNWSDFIIVYKVLGLNILCKYLGNVEDVGEIVNIL